MWSLICTSDKSVREALEKAQFFELASRDMVKIMWSGLHASEEAGAEL